MAAIGGLVAGRYRIERPLAAGGLGRVWLAMDERLGRPVAIKEIVPPGGLAGTEHQLVRGLMIREAHMFARIHHHHLVRVLDVLPGATAPWIVMEFVPSRSLLEVIETSGGLTPGRAAAVGLAVLAALEAAGRAGVLHLDVKPGNVLMADDGRILLTDFGPAVTAAGLASLAGAGLVFGSPKYLAPERLAGGVATARADLWSLGATLYHAVEGRPPYGWAGTEATLRALAESTPDPPRRAGPLAPVLAGLLQRDPADRLTATEAAEAMRKVPAASSARMLTPRRRVLVAAALLVTGGLVAGGLVAGGRGPGGPAGGAGAGDPDGSPPAAAGAAGGASPVAVTTARPIRLPAGYTWHNDPAGFRIAVPAGWRASRDAGGGLLLGPPKANPGGAAAGGPSVRVRAWTPPAGNIVTVLMAEERAVRLADYRRIRIEPLAEAPDALWEFIYRDPAAGPMRGLRRVIDIRGRTYLIEWRAPRTAWAAGQATLTTMLDSFGPAPVRPSASRR